MIHRIHLTKWKIMHFLNSGKGIKNGLEAALMKKIWFHLGWQMKMGI